MVLRSTVENQNAPRTTFEVFGKKRLVVDNRNYIAELRQNHRGMFVRMEEVHEGERGYGAIIVDSLHLGRFMEKVESILKFYLDEASNDVETKQENGQDGFPVILKSEYLSVRGKRYFFDLKLLGQDNKALRISSPTSFGRRNNFTILCEGIESLLSILREFVEICHKENGQTAQADSQKFVRKTTFESNTTPNSGMGSKNHGNVSKTRRSFPTLTVLDNPQPAVVEISNKAYRFEVVAGVKNSFIRITEQISHGRKHPIHVPIEGCIELKNSLVDFISKIPNHVFDDAEKARSSDSPKASTEL